MDNQYERPPERLEWNGTIYEFKCNKANTLCYVSNPAIYWEDSERSIIVEYRPTKSLKERFYVLYSLASYKKSNDVSGINVDIISGNRMAKPL